MTTDYITHDEAMVNDFVENPEYAEELLNAVLQDGDEYEIQRVRTWYNEAKYLQNITTNFNQKQLVFA